MAADGKLPLGILRQAVMKIDSAVTDIRECYEDDDISDDDRAGFQSVYETLTNVEAALVNIAMNEIGEQEFLDEHPEMDPIDPWPGKTGDDIMDDSIE